MSELRNPVAKDLSGLQNRFWLDAWPKHPYIHIGRGDALDDQEPDAPDGDPEPLIRIRRASLTPCPKPPEILSHWLKPGWETVDRKVEVLPARNVQNKQQQTLTIEFAQDPNRVSALEYWSAERAKWEAAERPAVEARKLFEAVRALWSDLQRQGDRVELMLADGILHIPEQSIRHPVLMQRLSLDFDPAGPEFCFNASAEKVELHRPLLRSIPDIEGRLIAQFDAELDMQPIEPLGGVSTQRFLQRLVQGLFSQGEYFDQEPESPPAAAPCLWRAPVLFLRPRTAGLSTTLDLLAQHLEEGGGTFPEGLERIIGIDRRDPPAVPASAPAPDILFSKPANAEQYAIAERLASARGVLVQGPPGTGKTHTIANLLGHLLAQGKTVLVTAHTTKALRVLRDQVDVALQPLCLSVLDSDAESQTQLARAAQIIADRLSRSDATELRRQACNLRQQRDQLLNEADILRRQIRDARYSEVEEIIVGGEGIRPIDAAKQVRENAAHDGWIPGPLTPGFLCPLTDLEVHELYAAHPLLSLADEAQLAQSQPAMNNLITPGDFRRLAAEQTRTEQRAQTHRPQFWIEASPIQSGVSALRQIYQRIQAATAMLDETQPWLREVLFAGWIGGDLVQTWQDLIEAIETLAAEAATAQRLIAAHGPELPPEPSAAEIVATLGEVIVHLERGGKLGIATKLTKRAWHRLIEGCRVENRSPQTLDEFRALSALAQLQENRQRFTARWHRTVGGLDGPTVESLSNRPERTAQSYIPEIRKRLIWRTEVWEPLLDKLRQAGFRWEVWLAEHPPVPGDHGELTRIQRAAHYGLAEVVEAQAARLWQAELAATLTEQRTCLTGFPQSELARILLYAQQHWEADRYDQTYDVLARLEGLRDLHQKRRSLLERLKPVALVWAQAIAQRRPPHDADQPPGNPAAAWRWRQWHEALELRAALSTIDLQTRLDRAELQLRGIAAQIIEAETWAAQRDRTQLEEQQALQGYVLTIRKIGKGTGQRAPELRQQARHLLSKARRAVPVWIMPLYRVYESFDPRTTRFDVVIIDEASQSDVTALAAIYLGAELVVVGDKEQVTPDAVGQTISSVQQLIATDLQGIPLSHLFDGQTSIYDLAEAAFGGRIALSEHFRCVPDIIQFSNALSYHNQIRPLREPFATALHPAVVEHHTSGSRSQRGKTNEEEAHTITTLLVACLHDPAYACNERGEATSFGVISLLGDEQALLIEQLLRQRVPPELFARHRLLCGNAPQFQGDERDVIFLSMVDSPPNEGVLTKRGAGPRDLYKKRYNVAASRARNQLWVVHSLDPELHLQPGDLRRRLIEHARDPQALSLSIQQQQTDSIFERLVLQRLVAAGHRVRTQYPVGAYRIDLVVEGHQRRRLAVECDGERWHTHEQLQHDLERQAILERLGWTFARIRGSLFFRDPDAAMAPVFDKLDHLGIEPLGPDTAPETPEASVVLERIRRTAEALRREWQAEQAAILTQTS
ncbi:MAG: AAA domain-containing protein [Candidatus Competibacteraceae bacterium]